ncbi:MAG: Plug domain-containing protein [Bacteroidales bacterium]|nr:Plug domain-containing protein [Bacteroidales bacterium]
MTSILLSTICAIALNVAPLSAPTDTNVVYMIDYAKVENFDGSQLVGKVITSYRIQKEDILGVPTLFHVITTNSANGGSAPVVVLGNTDRSNVTVVSTDPDERPSITIRPSSSSSLEDILYFIDGKQVGADVFNKLEPKNVQSIQVMKDSSAAKYLQDLKDQGKYNGEINPKGGVIIVNLKK